MTPIEVVKPSFVFPAHIGFYFTDQTYHKVAPAKLDPSHNHLPPNTAVCITGGGQGLGESMALSFAKASAGGIIYVHAPRRNSTELVQRSLQ
jgi:hypothetical protein